MRGRRKFNLYVEKSILGEFDLMSDKDVAQEMGVTFRTVMRWNRKADWSHIRDERRKLYSRHTAKVDAGVIARAMKGDIAAAQLFYERFDGYLPTSKQIQVHDIDEKLIDDELSRLMQRKLDTARVIATTAIPTEEVDAARGKEIAGVGADQALSPAT